ncbi:MAG: hypothetical protein R3A52_12720 [Polyangiales bacterium]
MKFETTVRSTALPLRQLGDQEIDITRVVEGFWEYAVMVTDPMSVRYHLERALAPRDERAAGAGVARRADERAGARVDPEALTAYDPSEDALVRDDRPRRRRARVLSRLERAERPVVLAGQGVRASGSHAAFSRVVGRLGAPVVTAWNAHDLVPDEHPLYAGRPGTVGDRAGNSPCRTATCWSCSGVGSTSVRSRHAWENFARAAFQGDGRRRRHGAEEAHAKRSTSPSPPTSEIFSRGWSASPTRRRRAAWLDRCRAWREAIPRGSAGVLADEAR